MAEPWELYEERIDKLKTEASRLRFKLTTVLEALALTESQYKQYREVDSK